MLTPRRCLVLSLLLLGAATTAAPLEARAAKGRATLVNRSGFDIHRLYLSSSYDDEWGPDQLGDQILYSGRSFELVGIPCDDYDVLLIDEDGDRCVVEEIEICGDAGNWTLSQEDLLECQGFVTSANATLVNNTSYTLVELYLSPSDHRRWGEDLLGRDVLQPRDSLTLEDFDCGYYDLRIVDEDGDVCVVNEIELCGDTGKHVLTDRQLLDCQGY